jgi:hypothetical protein
MESTIVEQQKNVDTAQEVIDDSSIEYKSGGFNRWGVNVESDSRSNRTSQFIDETLIEDNLDDRPEEKVAPSTNQSVPSDSNEEEDSESSSTEEPAIDNFAYYVAKQMIEEGALPPFEQVDEDITFEDIYENYKAVAQEQVKSQVLSEIQNTLASAGVTDENIVLLQAIQNGVPLDELYEVDKYQKYASLDEEASEDRKLEVIKDWYRSRNLSEREIARNLDAIEMSDEIDTEFNDAKNFFAKTIEEYHNAQRQAALAELEQRKVIQQRNEQILNTAITQGILAGEKLTSDQSRQIQSDIYERSKHYKIDNQDVYLSPFEEFLYLINNDFEFQLYNYKNYRFRNSQSEIMKQQAREEAEKDYLEAYKKAQGKSALKGSVKRKTVTTEDGLTGYINETGGRTFEF